MMRIGINTLFLIPGEVGGSETLLMESVQHLATHPESPQLILFANRENSGFLQSAFADCPGVTIATSNLRAVNRCARILYEQTVLPGWAARAGIDVLWSPGYTAPLAYRRPQVLSVLDMQYRRHPDDLSLPARLMTDLLVRAGVRRCRRIAAISEFTRTEILRFTRPTGPVDVVPLGVNPRLTQPCDPETIRRQCARHGIRKPYCLCVANTYPHKNVAALVDAFAGVTDRIPHQLVLIGKARRGENTLHRAIARGGAPLEQRFVRRERIDSDTLRALYQGADLFVFPSLYEGFGLPVLEAMASGTAVLATRRARAVAEIGATTIDYIENGTATEFMDAIPVLLNRPDHERRRKILRARQRAASFTWQRSADLLLNSLRHGSGIATPFSQSVTASPCWQGRARSRPGKPWVLR